MRKFHFVVLLLFGIFLMPTSVMACGDSSKEQPCKKEITSTKKEQKSCCGNDSSEDDKGCKGDCGHSKCSCTSPCPVTPFNLITEVVFQNNSYSFSLIERKQFSYVSPSISDGFKSIWLIPKIS